MVLEVVPMVLEVVLQLLLLQLRVLLNLPSPPSGGFVFLSAVSDNYRGHAYVGTLDGSRQHAPGATRTSLRPLAATFSLYRHA